MLADRALDLRGFLCPLPTVKAALAVEEMGPGQVLELTADDPATRRDLPAWCRDMGHTFLKIKEEGKSFRLYIRKKP